MEAFNQEDVKWKEKRYNCKIFLYRRNSLERRHKKIIADHTSTTDSSRLPDSGDLQDRIEGLHRLHKTRNRFYIQIPLRIGLGLIFRNSPSMIKSLAPLSE